MTPEQPVDFRHSCDRSDFDRHWKQALEPNKPKNGIESLTSAITLPGILDWVTLPNL